MYFLFGFVGCCSCIAGLSIYYWYKLSASVYKHQPFAIPAWCPDFLFPKVEVEITQMEGLGYISDEDDSDGPDFQNINQNPKSWETKYKPPNFLFEDR